MRCAPLSCLSTSRLDGSVACNAATVLVMAVAVIALVGVILAGLGVNPAGLNIFCSLDSGGRMLAGVISSALLFVGSLWLAGMRKGAVEKAKQEWLESKGNITTSMAEEEKAQLKAELAEEKKQLYARFRGDANAKFPEMQLTHKSAIYPGLSYNPDATVGDLMRYCQFHFGYEENAVDVFLTVEKEDGTTQLLGKPKSEELIKEACPQPDSSVPLRITVAFTLSP